MYASQPQKSIPVPIPAQLQQAERQWQFARKETGKRKDRKI